MAFRRPDEPRLRRLEAQIVELLDAQHAAHAEWRQLSERLTEVVSRLENAVSATSDARAVARDAQRLATEVARALELCLIDVNALRRDVDAAMETDL